MTYPVVGPGSALLERLDRVPRDGQWRTTREMSGLMKHRDAIHSNRLKVLEAGGAVESRPCECGNAIYWRRTAA